MTVIVRHFRASVGAGIGDDAIARDRDANRLCDLGDGAIGVIGLLLRDLGLYKASALVNGGGGGLEGLENGAFRGEKLST